MSEGQSIALVLDDAEVRAAHARGQHAWWLYSAEVLDHVRLPYDVTDAADARGRAARGDAVAVFARTGRIVTSAGETTFDPDLWERIVSIQQGRPVVRDGEPAPDGSAPVDDGLLKCDDGIVLSYTEDRALPPGEAGIAGRFPHEYPPPGAAPMFHRPRADLLRVAFLDTLLQAAGAAGLTLPWLHYWPAGVPAVAHMSHDSDGNSSEAAASGLRVFDEIDVRVTWCHCFPGGYTPEIVAEIGARGHEQALHYNAMGDADIASWGWPQFRAQYAWVQALTGRDDIVSNKNHYTRWEGWDEFFLWCERVGIRIDQSRGPSKQGNVGFPFGSCHLHFPIAGVDQANRRIDVLELPLHTQDLAWAGHESIRDVILDQAIAVHGVAHFLFHSAHLHTKPFVVEAARRVAAEARSRGMPWWTSAELNAWERARRGVRLAVTPDDAAGDARVLRVTVDADGPLKQAGVLLAVPGLADDTVVRVVEGEAEATLVTRHGRRFVELAVDVPAGRSTVGVAVG